MLQDPDKPSEVENSAANDTLNVNITIISNSIIKHSINDTLSNVNKNNHVNINNIVKVHIVIITLTTITSTYNVATLHTPVKIICRPPSSGKTTNCDTNVGYVYAKSIGTVNRDLRLQL